MNELVDRMADRLAALGHPARLLVLRAVLRGPSDGVPAGELQREVAVPASTLSYHLDTLSRCGLVTSARDGKLIRYAASRTGLLEVLQFLVGGCCEPAELIDVGRLVTGGPGPRRSRSPGRRRPGKGKGK
jgi:DNA-binding transcriptional ArsR family regulator